jgi:hypothetical protein
MRFAIEDREYEFDGKLSVEEAMLMHEKTNGLGLIKFNSELADGNPFAIAAWMFLLKRRAGEAVRWQDMLKLDVNTYKPIFDEIPGAGDSDDGDTGTAGEAAPDPTTPTASGKPRKRATSST